MKENRTLALGVLTGELIGTTRTWHCQLCNGFFADWYCERNLITAVKCNNCVVYNVVLYWNLWRLPETEEEYSKSWSEVAQDLVWDTWTPESYSGQDKVFLMHLLMTRNRISKQGSQGILLWSHYLDFAQSLFGPGRTTAWLNFVSPRYASRREKLMEIWYNLFLQK